MPDITTTALTSRFSQHEQVFKAKKDADDAEAQLRLRLERQFAQQLSHTAAQEEEEALRQVVGRPGTHGHVATDTCPLPVIDPGAQIVTASSVCSSATVLPHFHSSSPATASRRNHFRSLFSVVKRGGGDFLRGC